jgi:hypothetical protein
MRSGPKSCSRSSCFAREASARLSVKFTISPCAGPSIALCGSSTKLFGFRMPVIAARLLLVPVHALLHDSPLPVVGHEEPVQIKVKAVLDRGAVDFRDETAGTGQLGAIEADAFA